MKAYERILRARGQAPGQEAPPGEPAVNTGAYQAFEDTGGYPQMGFSIYRQDGGIDGFFYHNVDNLDLRRTGRGDYLSFTHRGKAVTLHGRGFEAVFQAIMQHTLVALYEFGDGQRLADPADCVITRIKITPLPGAAMQTG